MGYRFEKKFEKIFVEFSLTCLDEGCSLSGEPLLAVPVDVLHDELEAEHVRSLHAVVAGQFCSVYSVACVKVLREDLLVLAADEVTVVDPGNDVGLLGGLRVVLVVRLLLLLIAVVLVGLPLSGLGLGVGHLAHGLQLRHGEERIELCLP